MRTRVLFTLPLLALFLLCLIPVIADEQPAPAAAPVETVAPVAPAVPAAPAEPAPAAPAPAPKLEIPAVTPDTQLFRRTPKIDGTIEDGEWDTYYTFSTGGWDVSTYVDWDSKNLYVAAKSNKAIDLLAFLDANADGWLNGEDNIELSETRGANDALSLTVDRYDSRHAKSTTPVPVADFESAMVETKSSTANGGSMIEVRIPAGLIRGLKLSSGKKIGLLLAAQISNNGSVWMPSGSAGDTVECSLVTKKIASLKPLDLGFDIRDEKIARGEDLVAKFHMTNSGTETVDVRSFVVGGEGKADPFLNTEKIRCEGLAPKKHISHDVRSIVPSDMPLGCWAIGAEVKSADGRLGGVLASFEVVEPFEVELNLPEKPVAADAKDVSVGVRITNNMRRSIHGSAVVKLPTGWELWKNADKRDFAADGGGSTSVTFKAKQPLGIEGDVPVKMDITVNGKTVTVEGKFSVASP